MARQIQPLTLLMVVMVGLLWGLNWPAVKSMLTAIPPMTLRASAFTCAAVILMAVARVLDHRIRPARGEGRALFVTGLFVLFGFNLCSAFGQLFTPASNAAIIAYTMPAMTAVLSALYLGEVLDARRVLAIGIGLTGLAVLASANLAALRAAPLGPAIMLMAALSWSIGNVLMQAHRWTLSPLVRAAWFFVISGMLMWPLALIFEPLGQLRMPGAPVLWIFAFHVGGPMVACYMMWTVLLGRLPASVAAISTLIAPVVGVLSSALLLGEELSWQKAVALCLILASIGIALIRPAPQG